MEKLILWMTPSLVAKCFSCIQNIKLKFKCLSDEQVTRVRLILIKYTDDNGVEAEFRVKKEIAPKWDDLASLLELQNAEITSIRQGNQHQDETCTDRMLMKWMEREENHSWRNLIQAMNGVQLAHAASVLAKALRNRI